MKCGDISYSEYRTKKLQQLCQKKDIPVTKTVTKEILITYLRIKDKVNVLKSLAPEMNKVITQHQIEEEKLQERRT